MTPKDKKLSKVIAIGCLALAVLGFAVFARRAMRGMLRSETADVASGARGPG